MLFSSCFLLSACDSDDSNNTIQSQSGNFIDSPVQGVSYVSGNTSGMTDGVGQFIYEPNAQVMFMIGDIALGSAAGASTITPVELVNGAVDEANSTVTNIARFLQTLDDDGNPDNGITITSDVTNLAISKNINFSQSITDFENDGNVQTCIAELTAVTSAGARTLVSAAQAQSHLNASLIALLAGDYNGTFSGGDVGSFSLTIANDGSISGIGQGSDEAFTFTGNVNSSGSAAAGNVSTGAMFVMAIARDGSIVGTWNNTIFGLSGSLVGSKN